jgi:DNA polymerase-3 subunit gamma/tau
MSYLVLARKWRPQTFAEIIGQPHVATTLENAILARRVAHAYLFTGARGVGKTSVARILAKALNCERGISPHPCNQCSNCREITQGNAVDVLEIDGASNRGIDSIRELRETVRYRPAKSPYKIYIIDEVHMLTPEAFNALLKTLEEPPAHILFIFATTEPHKIPTTILSRCQRFDFRRIPTGLIVAHLREIIRQEGHSLSDAMIFDIAREAEGSMRDAQSLLEQLLAFGGGEAVESDLLDLLGIIDRRSVHRTAEAILESDPMTCLQVVADLYQRGIDIKRFCHQLCEHFRNLLWVALGKDSAAAWLDLPAEELKAVKGQVETSSPETLQLYFQMILKGEEDIRRSHLPRIALEMLLVRLTQLPRLESLQSVLHKLDVLEKKLEECDELDSGRAARDSSASPAGRAAGKELSGPALHCELTGRTPSASPGDVEELPFPLEEAGGRAPQAANPATALQAATRWPAFLQWLEGKDPVLAAKLAQSRVTAEDNAVNTLTLELAELFAESVQDPKSLTKLTETARTYFGQTFRWVTRRQPAPGPVISNTAPSPQQPKSSRVRVMEHPAVQQALEILGGELVDIRRLKTRQKGLETDPNSMGPGDRGDSPD